MKEIKGNPTIGYGENSVKIYFPDKNRKGYEVVFVCQRKILARLQLKQIHQISLLEELLRDGFAVTPHAYSKKWQIN